MKLHEMTEKINKLVTLKSYYINFLNSLMATPHRKARNKLHVSGGRPSIHDLRTTFEDAANI